MPPAKLIATVTVLAVLWTLESLAPLFAGRQRRTRHIATNLAVGLFNSVVLGFIFAFAFRWEADRIVAPGWGLLGLFEAPRWVETAIAIVLFDAWMYLWHRANHRIPLLWRFHRAHHTDAEMDASSAVRFHPIEIAYSSCLRLLVIPLIGIDLAQLAIYEAALLPVILFHHSNIHMPYRLDAALRAVIVTPWMHWVHHSDRQPETDSNYSSLFSWCDRIGGTFRIRTDPLAIRYGLSEFREPRWATLWGFLKTPFTSLKGA
jgi:sterol desaturase/sphingolipid hydroxylase (fatty acid hydroxylase superfamily)